MRPNTGWIQGFFDYRPRNEQESVVTAISTDLGKSWVFKDQALGLNPYCPADQTDPDNNNVIVNGLITPYASNSANAADNGLGHAFVLTIGGDQLMYQLNRANNHIDHDQLVVHMLMPKGTHPLASLPAFGYVSPLASMGYPMLEGSAQMTDGLMSPDAVLGAVPFSDATTLQDKVVDALKTLGDIPADFAVDRLFLHGITKVVE